MAYLQILLNSITSGLLLALAAYAFTLVFRITRAFHLAQAGLYVGGVYAYLYLFQKFAPTGILSHFAVLILAIGVCFILAWLIEKTIYLPIYNRRGNETLTLIGSLGANAIMINLIAIFFGNEVKTAPEFFKIWSLEPLPGLMVTNLQLIQTAIAVIIFAALHWLLNKSTRLLTFKAVADNSDLAEVSGIRVRQIRMRAMVGGSLLVMIAGILQLYDIGIGPYSGVDLTLSAAVIAILTGSIGVWETVIVAIVLALLQNLIEWFLSAQWREGLTFFFLLIVMLWRTEGVLTYQLRKDA